MREETKASEKCYSPSAMVPKLSKEDAELLKKRDGKIVKAICRRHCESIANKCTDVTGETVTALTLLALLIMTAIDVAFGKLSFLSFMTDLVFSILIAVGISLSVSYFEFKEIYDLCYELCTSELKKLSERG